MYLLLLLCCYRVPAYGQILSVAYVWVARYQKDAYSQIPPCLCALVRSKQLHRHLNVKVGHM